MYLNDAIAAYEAQYGPIAARATTRTAATEQLKLVFWRVIWPAIRDQTLTVKWGWFSPTVRVRALKPLFERVFGPDPDGLTTTTATLTGDTLFGARVTVRSDPA